MLAFRDVVKRYASGDEIVRAVDGVSLEVEAGEVVALFGPSGSGKSTLLMIAAAVLRPDAGTVSVAGQEVSTLGERDGARYRLRELGFIRQTFDLLDGASAIDNAAIKLWGTGVGVREARRRVTPLLEELGLGARLEHRPDELSMGERQRVAIARALSTGPQVLLADEPTGSLDRHRSEDVLALLRALTRERGIATLLVTHDAQAVDHVDRALTLRDGAIADGAL